MAKRKYQRRSTPKPNADKYAPKQIGRKGIHFTCGRLFSPTITGLLSAMYEKDNTITVLLKPDDLKAIAYEESRLIEAIMTIDAVSDAIRKHHKKIEKGEV